jgi:hypothetical protein
VKRSSAPRLELHGLRGVVTSAAEYLLERIRTGHL